MKIFMTGATSYLGGNLAQLLVKEGHTVHCLIRKSSVMKTLNSLNPAPRCWVHDGHMESMVNILKQVRPDQVIHMASKQAYDHRPDEIDSLLQSNIQLGLQLVEAATLVGCTRFINTGSYWEFGENSEKGAASISIYAAMKKGFRDILDYYRQYKALELINLILFDTYGPSDPRGKIVSLLAEAAKTGQELSLSPGEQRIYLTHVDDVCRAYLCALELKNFKSGVCFAVRSENPVSLRELVVCFEKAIGKNISIAWGGLPYANRQIMQPWNGPTLPGWTTKVPLDHGLAQLQSDKTTL